MRSICEVSYFRAEHRFLRASIVESVSEEKKKLMMIVMINIMLKKTIYVHFIVKRPKEHALLNFIATVNNRLEVVTSRHKC